MKNWMPSVVVVIVIALALGLAFHQLYPRVDLTSELYALFVFVAVAMKLAVSKLWSLRGTSRTPVNTEANK
jgi:hypothetical protein